MRPQFMLTCSNPECSEHDKEMVSEQDPFDFKWYACDKCRRQMDVRIIYDGQTFLSTAAYGGHLQGLLKEIEGIRKLIDRNVAEPEEEARFATIIELLRDAKCSCCLQPLLDENDVPTILRYRKHPKK